MKALCLFSIFVLISSCSDAGMIRSAPSETNLLADGEDQPNSSNTGQATTTVNEPIMIGGQFLVCANDDQLAQQDDSEGSFGCRIELADGTKLNTLSPTNEDIIAEGESILIQGQANNNPDDFWHWTFPYYPDQRDLIIVKLVNPAISVVKGMTEVLDAHPERTPQDLEDEEDEEVEDDEGRRGRRR